jgi:hypothetical protein
MIKQDHRETQEKKIPGRWNSIEKILMKNGKKFGDFLKI